MHSTPETAQQPSLESHGAFSFLPLYATFCDMSLIQRDVPFPGIHLEPTHACLAVPYLPLNWQNFR